VNIVTAGISHLAKPIQGFQNNCSTQLTNKYAMSSPKYHQQHNEYNVPHLPVLNVTMGTQ